nr:ethanolamine utilization protein EutJ [Tessaracoccus coleopterorum]
MAAVDGSDAPIAGARMRSTVVRDGVVIDWLGAVRAVKKLRDALEASLGIRFDEAAVAVPPGIDKATIKIFTNVIEAAGLESAEVVDEPVAAATALGIATGAVIDIGHGTTGVSILRDGIVELSADEATGGQHMSLVVAGALGIDFETAEKYKRKKANADLVFGLIRPTIEKMATIAAGVLDGQPELSIHLVGGASSLPGTAEVFAEILGRPVTQAPDPLYPTPLGTAMRRTHE